MPRIRFERFPCISSFRHFKMQGKVSFDLYFWNDLHLQRVTNTVTRNFPYFLTTECSLDRRKKKHSFVIRSDYDTQYVRA